ncbi:MAG: hypothetical protein A3D31_02065 [Candidatus Fluviicola riflensis]|nr:MAG: hypothetical protein CHH17_12970 [Candidatus Fluviicola riflensis]OGS78782.1 MAG: hypothetical protein A3D31_02065 [Candidatus Fluviicola riflensis]OGS86213.1 MAG: hypothetical protein A2724_01520 [Fluviicola sp. RIFCSPHIGHO2_01_FULL_43_53]OGS87655.1 MAG: hypothetical protein A3E30_16325 [Fluviicola sp. RIFCSPHIGHO2_12_FULL_43_24]
MSIIKDLNEFHFTLKSALFNILISMPFWYLDIYLMAKWYVEQNPIQLPIVIAFCLSVGWYVVSFLAYTAVSAFMFKSKNEGKTESELDGDIDKDTFLHCMLSIVFLGTLSLFAYLNKDSFLIFTVETFISAAMVMVGAIIWSIGKTFFLKR